MKLYLIRHGLTILNKEGRASGFVDVPLEPEGREMAQRAATELPADITEIHSSDLIRCKETTEILNADRGLPVTFDARLRERNFGSLERSIIQEWDLELREKDLKQAYDYRPYGGESVEDVRARIDELLHELKERRDAVPLLVTSGGIVRLFAHVFAGTTHHEVGNCAIHEFEINL